MALLALHRTGLKKKKKHVPVCSYLDFPYTIPCRRTDMTFRIPLKITNWHVCNMHMHFSLAKTTTDKEVDRGWGLGVGVGWRAMHCNWFTSRVFFSFLEMQYCIYPSMFEGPDSQAPEEAFSGELGEWRRRYGGASGERGGWDGGPILV